MLFWLDTLFTITTLYVSILGHPVGHEPSSLLRRLDAGETQCSTEEAATASECQSLLSNPPVPDWTNIATGSTPVFKPFCSGSCCLFTDTPNVPTDELLSAGTTLMGCTEPANGLVSGVTKTDTAGVCLADTTGGN
ncbi:hypothetical protein C8R44DRAFT_861293, partial [Mycena epipterygia]